MTQNTKNTPNNKGIKAPKFNFYWIYGGIFVLFLVYQFFSAGDLSSKNLSQNEFKTILTENDISRIDIVNKNVANIYIKKEAQDKEKHKKNKSSLYSGDMPMYSYSFGDLQNFEKELSAAKELKQLDFDVKNVEKTNFFEQILMYLPFIFLIGLWIYFMRRMSGGGA